MKLEIEITEEEVKSAMDVYEAIVELVEAARKIIPYRSKE